MTRTCERCEEEKSRLDVHKSGYHKRSDAAAGDSMDVLAYLCEECIVEVFGEFVEVEIDYKPQRKQ